MKDKKEVWKYFKEGNTKYGVSNFGRIRFRNKKGIITTETPNFIMKLYFKWFYKGIDKLANKNKIELLKRI